MKTEVAGTVKDLKSIGVEITQWENRAEVAKAEAERLNRTNDALQASISKKTQDFDVYMNQKDAEVKKSRAALLADQEQMAKDKAEFQTILQQHKKEKSELENQKNEFEIQKLKHSASIQNVQEFVTAIRRAVGLLGI